NHEEYGFDPDRVVVMGGSAGGYLAAMVSTLDNPSLYLEKCPNNYPSRKVVRAAVIFYGFFDFTDLDAYHESDIESFSMFWGAKQNEIPAELFIEMSPAKQIDGSEPPFILLHGTADYFVPSEISENFAKSLSQAGVDVELVLVPDAGHAFETKPLTGEEMSFSLGKIEAFLDRVLTP
ncbi:MAG: prolyl oligopeptidase family serine peptidase, partial [candidate division Zixibacteria bacterium]|nr:prolyl oligopeptidase family serine peptidase [Gammaproteobacteria bacterium]NIX56390.1 prolyl oligopeptidase family serine peptidase [candidate division Zixibacteria bacterium]